MDQPEARFFKLFGEAPPARPTIAVVSPLLGIFTIIGAGGLMWLFVSVLIGNLVQ